MHAVAGQRMTDRHGRAHVDERTSHAVGDCLDFPVDTLGGGGIEVGGLSPVFDGRQPDQNDSWSTRRYSFEERSIILAKSAVLIILALLVPKATTIAAPRKSPIV